MTELPTLFATYAVVPLMAMAAGKLKLLPVVGIVAQSVSDVPSMVHRVTELPTSFTTYAVVPLMAMSLGRLKLGVPVVGISAQPVSDVPAMVH